MAKKNANEIVEETTDIEQAENVAPIENAEPSPRRAEKPKGKYLVSGSDFHEFTTNDPVFVGMYTGRNMIREKDGKEENQKAGDIMGHYFVDPDGVETVIGSSHSIAKAVGQIKEGDVLYIEFLGQKQVGAKKFNQFDIIQLTDVDEKARYGF